MNASHIAGPVDPDAYDAVFTALLEYRQNEIISTRTVLRDVRRLAPECRMSDDEMVALIVKMATDTTLGVSFDQREVA